MNFLNNLNNIQKKILFIFIINFFLGIPIYDKLGLTGVGAQFFEEYYWDVIFEWRYSGFWWSVNIVLLIGFYLFRNNEE